MANRVPISDVRSAFRAYVRLAGTIGFDVDRDAVFRHLLQNGAKGQSRALKAMFNGPSKGKSGPAETPTRVLKSFTSLQDGLITTLRARLDGRVDWDKCHNLAARVREAVADLTDRGKRRLVRSIEKSPHRRFLRRRPAAAPSPAAASSDTSPDAQMPIEQFHRLLREYARDQTIARTRLVLHLQAELKKRGLRMSQDSIEDRFRQNTRAKSAPACLRQIIRGLDDTFLTGLVPIETMCGETPAGAWLEERRAELGFLSNNAMHKAIAESTGLNYESVHKALTQPRKGQRIQCRIRDLIAEWRTLVAQGQPIPANAEYLGVPGAEVRRVLIALARLYPSASAMRRDAADVLGTKPAAVRRLVAEDDNGRRRVPLRGFQALAELLEKRKKRSRQVSYLGDRETRRLAAKLAAQANEALRVWERRGRDPAFHRAYRRARLQVIVAIKERRTNADWAVDAAFMNS